jgi:Ser/Thr protein kinase RdoA (MazF antagonist)
MSVAVDVLAHYPTELRGTLTPLGNHGGFSGAALFRVEAQIGALCLRAWPADVTSERVTHIHCLMQRGRDAGLDSVPRMHATVRGKVCVQAANRFWELSDWMPGTACDRSTVTYVQAACVALARIHLAWRESTPSVATAPAIARRLAVVRDWLPHIAAGWRPRPMTDDPVAPWAERAWTIVRTRLPALELVLGPWLNRPLLVQPCLCDIWSAHVLFTDERVTGLVDFGSCKQDHIAVDLARLLGSMAGDDAALWYAGLEAYARLCPLTAEEQALAHALDRSGVVVAAANWLRWLYREGRQYPDRTAVAARLANLLSRTALING